MNWVIVYKSSLHPEGGLLSSSYYVEQNFATVSEWNRFAPYVVAFDRAFNGSQTAILCVVCVPATADGKPAGNKGFAYCPTRINPYGARPVAEPLPWRWSLLVSHTGRRGSPHSHWYHDSLDRSEVTYGHRGQIVLRTPETFWQDQEIRLGEAGTRFREWLRRGHGSAKPGGALSFDVPREVLISGVSLRNAARRHQALLFKQSVNFQLKVVGAISAGAIIQEELLDSADHDNDRRMTPRLKPITTNLMGTVLALHAAYKENNKGKNGQDINDGDGWRVRYGPTGADLAQGEDLAKQKQEEDLKFLQLFPSSADANGEEYFTAENGRQWIKVALEWAEQIGQFGAFDFFNLDQEGLEDDSRVDNYTPGYPDLPTKVENLPPPTKKPGHLVEIPGSFV